MVNLGDKELMLFFDFRFCVDAILSIIDYSNVIEKNKSQLQHGSNIHIANFKKKKYPIFLESYLLLEIKSLYDITEKYKEKGFKLPEPPEYYGNCLLHKFRSKIIAHKDKEGDYETYYDWIKLPELIGQIGAEKIREDVLFHIKKCQEIIPKIKI